MLIYLRRISGKERSRETNLHLGLCLSFNAGALNAGAFLAIKQYTSHVTGIVSGMADHLALGNIMLALGAFCVLLSFIFGAALSELLISWARNRQLQSEFAFSLVCEAILMFIFFVMGEFYREELSWFVSGVAMLLSFTMGLQNAIITRISNALIRTTHMTGMATDIGIELGRMLYWNRNIDKEDTAYIRANRERLVLFCRLVFMFFLGGVIGAWGFDYIGFWATIPLAFVLLILAIMPVLDDILFSRMKR